MQIRRTLLVTAAVLAVSLLQSGADSSRALAQAAAALSGQVTSAEEGAMEGVMVTAKKAGSTVAISVASDADGKFSFPAAKIEPGDYTIRIRAIGYELDGPKTVTVGAQAAPVAVKLKKTRNLAAQLTSAEWFMSFPGTAQEKAKKAAFMDRCTSCHTYERIAKSTYDTDGFIKVLQRMGTYAPGHHAIRAAEAQGKPCRDESGAAAPARRIPGQHQSERVADLGLSAEDAAAAQRPFHQGRDHRIRSAA